MHGKTRSVFAGIALSILSTAGNAQVQQGAAARTFTPTGSSAAAIAHFAAGMTDYEQYNAVGARNHLLAALAADPAFGLARARLAQFVGGAPSQNEYARAAVDASKGSAGEAMMTLAIREAAAGRAANARAIWDALTQLHPDDRLIALERARSRVGADRTSAIREVTRRFPDYGWAKSELALALLANPLTVYSKDVADEALANVQALARLHPDAAGTHFVMGYVHQRLLDHDQARAHLDRAIAIQPYAWHFDVKAEIAAREKKVALARALLDSAIALSPSAPAIAAYRRSQAVLRAYDGSIADALAALAPLARQAEADSLPGQAQTNHITIGLFRAAAGDAAGYEAAVAEAKRVQATVAALADNQIIAYGLLGDGPKARAALAGYTESAQSQAPDVRDENIHRMTGIVAYAEGKYDEAIMHLKQGGTNPYVDVFTIEALRKQGKAKEAAAVRTALLARKNVSLAATSIPIAIQRAKVKK